MIAMHNLDISGLISRPDLSREDLLDYIDTFPALLWRIEIARSRIEFLNSQHIAGLGDRTGLFMKSPEFRTLMVLPEDLHFLEGFMEAMKEAKAAECIFRIRDHEGAVRWLKLVGWTHPKDLRYYMGHLLDVSDRAEAIKSIIEKDAELQLMIELADNPVIILDFDTKQVVSQNMAASRLFLYSPDEFRNLFLQDLYHRGMTNMVHRLLNEIIFSKKWEGKLLFERKTNSVFTAETSTRFLIFRERRLLRVSLTNITASEPEQEKRKGRGKDRGGHKALLEQGLLARLDGLSDMESILRVMLDHQLPNFTFDAILFSDIHARKNRVYVYATGQPFASMAYGEMYSYEGTVAQDIERFKLDYLIVDETLDSIKAIDWALFIPKGIRSYFAKPFYQRGVLRSVMILCSLHPKTFLNEGLSEYSILFEPFQRAVQAWRSAQRCSRMKA
ncbi:hypothetical protein V6C53_09950 [Desulfocurvibacter africanus]|uniref:hypothetical protein n=1 Tax=Desulfocurvibacter africanus TaxID=873 RepID=UPI002FD91133